MTGDIHLRNGVCAAVDHGTFFRQCHVWIWTGRRIPSIRHRMRAGKAGVDGLHALTLHRIAVRCLGADQLIGSIVDLLIPADKAISVVCRCRCPHALAGIGIIVGGDVVSVCAAADHSHPPAVAVVLKTAAVLHLRDKALAPLPLRHQRRAADHRGAAHGRTGGNISSIPVEGKRIRSLIVDHGMLCRQKHFVSCQQPTGELPAVLRRVCRVRGILRAFGILCKRDDIGRLAHAVLIVVLVSAVRVV